MSPTRKFAGIAPFFAKRVYPVISEELGARIEELGGALQRRECVVEKMAGTYETNGTYRTGAGTSS